MTGGNKFDDELRWQVVRLIIFATFGTIFLTMLLSSLAGCSPRIVEAEKIEYIERWHDTTIYIDVPVEKVRIVTFDTVSVIGTERAISEALVSGGQLHHSIKDNPDFKPQTVIKWKEVLRDTTIVQKEVEYVEKELTKWQTFFIQFGKAAGIVVVLALAFLAYRFTRRF